MYICQLVLLILVNSAGILLQKPVKPTVICIPVFLIDIVVAIFNCEVNCNQFTAPEVRRPIVLWQWHQKVAALTEIELKKAISPYFIHHDS